MYRAYIVVVAMLISFSIGTTHAIAQISKQLDEKAKEAQSAEKKSWEQVDQINKETDKTNMRLQESRQSPKQHAKQPGSTVTKTKVGVESPYSKKTKTRKAVEATRPRKGPEAKKR